MRQSSKQNIYMIDASIDQIGSTIPSSQVFSMSAMVVVTGTSSGTVYIQCSDDCPPDVSASGMPSHWVNINNQSVAVSGSGVYLIPKFDVCYNFLRSHYVATNASGGGISANITTLGI